MTATPNHALQRTASFVTAPASTAAFPPTAQVPRRTPLSLSLGSLAGHAPVKIVIKVLEMVWICSCWLVVSAASGASIALETDELVGRADAILVTRVSDVSYAVEAFGQERNRVDIIRTTGTVLDTLKGAVSDKVELKQFVLSDCYSVLSPGTWLLFLKQTTHGLTVWRDAWPVKDGKVEWYSFHYKKPTYEEFEKGAPLNPLFSKQPIETVAEDIRRIVSRLKHVE